MCPPCLSATNLAAPSCPHDPEHHMCAVLILMIGKCLPNPCLHPKWEYSRKNKTATAMCFLYLAYFCHLHYHSVLIRHLSLQPIVYAFSQITMGTVIILPKVIKTEALKKLLELQVYSS